MKIIRIPLQPHSHFHFGEFKVDSNVALSTTSDHAYSDSLFSAIINSYLDLKGDAQNFVDDYLNKKISISSLFYYLEATDENRIVYLLPKPSFLDLFTSAEGKHKMFNQIKFVSNGIWEMGFDTSKWTEEEDSEVVFIQNHEILITKEEATMLKIDQSDFVFQTVDIPKSPIRKANPDDSIFYQSDIEIGKIDGIEIGFYFFYIAEQVAESRLKDAVNLISYSSIGGEKQNIGRIMMQPIFGDTINLASNAAGNKGFTNLSLINPESEMELQDVVYSQTILRGGRETGKGTYKVVRMIKEGALLSNDKIKGRLVEIGTDFLENKALRNGKAFIVPITYTDNNEKASN